MNAPVWLFDLDGSLADFEASLGAALRETSSPADLEAYGDFSWTSKAPSWFKARKDLIQQQPGFWVNLPVIDFGMELYCQAGLLGYKRVVLTKAPFGNSPAWSEKAQWCRKYLPDASVIIGDDKEFKGQVHGDVLYDDWPPYIQSWLGQHPHGKALMLEAAYNKDFVHPRVLRCQRTPLAGQLDNIFTFLGLVKSV